MMKYFLSFTVWMGVSAYGISYHEEYGTISYLEETKAFIAENMEPGDVVVYDTDSRFGQLFGCYMPDQIFYTMEEVPDLEELVGDLTLTRLNAIFQSLMRRQNDKIDPIRSKFGQIEQEEVSLDEKMMDLRTYAQEHATFRFSELMREQKGKIQMIVTFLAVLELMKTGELTVVQEHLFDDMLITSQL